MVRVEGVEVGKAVHAKTLEGMLVLSAYPSALRTDPLEKLFLLPTILAVQLIRLLALGRQPVRSESCAVRCMIAMLGHVVRSPQRK